jgi:hypothetical protein
MYEHYWIFGPSNPKKVVKHTVLAGASHLVGRQTINSSVGEAPTLLVPGSTGVPVLN